MSRIGNGRINPFACTPAETAQNWMNVQNIFTTIVELIEEGGTTDTYKVAVNAAAVAGLQFDYLHNVLHDNATYNSDADLIIGSETVSDDTERLFVDSSEITGYTEDAGVLYALTLFEGTVQWAEIDDAVDTYQVKVTTDDTTPKFLHDCTYVTIGGSPSTSTIVDGQDLIIASNTIGNAGTNQKERYYVDVSEITDFHASDFKLLGIEAGNSKYFDATSVSGAIEQYRFIRGLTTALVTAGTTNFNINNVLPLGSGLDPVSGNAATTVSVQRINGKEAIPASTPVIAAYDGAAWELIPTERFRMVRGQATSAVTASTGTFNIDNIKTLASGLDPRSNPASTTETLEVTNVALASFTDDGIVFAAYNVANNTWDVLPNANSGAIILVKIEGTISARSGTTRGSGTAQPVDANLTNSGPSITVYNASADAFVGTASAPRYIHAASRDGVYFICWPEFSALTNWNTTKDQMIGHTASGANEWKDLVSLTLNNPTSIELTDNTTQLTSTLPYTPYVTTRIWATQSNGSEFTDSVTITNC